MKILLILLVLHTKQAVSVRLTRLFQLIDGYSSETSLRGFLHIGNEYAVFLRVPKPNDRILTYELYEAKNENDLKNYRPRLLAVSEVPIQYIKDQLKTFRSELYTSKNGAADHVPGSLVKTMREWQLEQVLKRDVKGKEAPSNVLQSWDDDK